MRSALKVDTDDLRGTGTVVSNAHTANERLPESNFLALGREADAVEAGGTGCRSAGFV
jgi:hypothetical protein